MKMSHNAVVELSWAVRIPIHATAMLLWVVVIFVFQLYGTLTIADAFAQFNDPCNPFHESANNAGGWSIAATAILIPLFLGLYLRKFLTIAWIIICAFAQINFFAYNILNGGSC